MGHLTKLLRDTYWEDTVEPTRSIGVVPRFRNLQECRPFLERTRRSFQKWYLRGAFGIVEEGGELDIDDDAEQSSIELRTVAPYDGKPIEVDYEPPELGPDCSGTMGLVTAEEFKLAIPEDGIDFDDLVNKYIARMWHKDGSVQEESKATFLKLYYEVAACDLSKRD